MSVAYRAVGWSPQKVKYDLAVAGFAGVYLAVFAGASLALQPRIAAETLVLRASGSLAFVMLTGVLAAGPLARLSPRFLPVLRNRRHLGVATFLAASAHGALALFQFHFLGNLDPLASLLSGGGGPAGPDGGAPFQLLGALALAVLFVMAATSHDFWLATLTPATWKGLHMLVYAAYAALVGHVVLGALQEEGRSYLWAVAVGAGAALVAVQLAAGMRERRQDRAVLPEAADPPAPGFVRTVRARDVPEARAKVVVLSGERVAVFRHRGVVSCVSNVCRHQMGPVGEGRIVDGCITCPWHGFQYDPVTGCAPSPFKDRLETHDVVIRDDFVWVDPEPNPLGTPARTARIDETAEPAGAAS